MAEDLGSIYSEIRVRFDKLDSDIAKVDTKFNTLKKDSEKHATSVKTSWTSAFGKIKLKGVASIAAVSVALKSAAKIGATFEQSIANVGSVASGSAADLLELKEAAKEAGETTRFTASEAADALYSLASAGLSAKESVEALDGVLEFSGATQSDLATSSALVVSVLSQYNLEADQAATVSNVLAAAIGNSLANMDKLRLSLQQAGSVAGGLNIDLEDTVGALEALFDAGYTGEKAGTALRNIYSYLADSTSTVTQELAGMGAEIDKLNPQTNDLADIIDYLNELGLDTGQVFAAFGNEVGGQMVSLMSTGGDAIREYTEEITGTTAATEMYATQNDTLAGSFDRMVSAIQSLAIELVETVTPALRAVLSMFTDFSNTLTTLIRKLNGNYSASEQLEGKYTDLEEAVKNYNDVMEKAEGKTDAVTQAMVSQAKAALNLALQEASTEYAESNKQLDKYNNTITSSQKKIDEYTETLDALAEGTGYTSDELSSMADTERAVILLAKKGEKAVAEYNIANEKRIFYTGKQTDATIALGQAEADQENFVNLLTKGYLENNEVTELLLDSYPELKQAVLDNVDAYQKAKDAEEKEIAMAKGLYEQYSKSEGLTESRAEWLKTYATNMLDSAKSTEAKEYWTKLLTIAENALNETEEETIEKNDTLQTQIDEYNEKLQDVGKSEKELRDLEEARAIANIKATIEESDARQDLIDAIEDYYDALDAQDVTDANNDLIEQNKEYKESIEEIGASEQELRDLEKQRAIDLINATDADIESKQEAIGWIEKYYQALADQDALDEAEAAQKEFAENTQEMWEDTTSSIISLFDELSSLFSALSDSRIEALEAEMDAELEALGLADQTDLEEAQEEYDEQAEAIQEVIDAYDEAIAAAQASGDAATVAALEAQKATQEEADAETLATYQAAVDKAAIEEEYAEKEAEIEYKYDLLSWKASLASATATAANAILTTMNSLPYPLNVAPTAAQTGLGLAQVAAVAAAKPTLATGGIILPKSGGVETIQAENGSPELSLNAGASGEPLMDMFASRIAANMGGNGSSNGTNLTVYLNMDSKTVASGVAKNINNGTVRINLK